MVATVLTSSAEDSRLTTPVVVLTGICTAIYLLDGLIHSDPGPARAGHRPLAAARQRRARADLLLQPASANASASSCFRSSRAASASAHRARVGRRLRARAKRQRAGDRPTGLFVFRLVTGVFLGGCLPSCLAIVTASCTTGPAGRLDHGAVHGLRRSARPPRGSSLVRGWATGARQWSPSARLALLTAAGAWLWLRDSALPRRSADADDERQAKSRSASCRPGYLRRHA